MGWSTASQEKFLAYIDAEVPLEPSDLELIWSFDPAFPISKLTSRKQSPGRLGLDAIKSFKTRGYSNFGGRSEDYLEDLWRDFKRDPERLPIIVDMHSKRKPLLIDGWHRTALTYLHDLKTIPAIIGQVK